MKDTLERRYGDLPLVGPVVIRVDGWIQRAAWQRTATDFARLARIGREAGNPSAQHDQAMADAIRQRLGNHR